MDYNKIIELVKQAGQLVFDKELKENVKTKCPSDFVTAVDLGISNFLKEELHRLAPEIAFMSEEEDGVPTGARWILDPIDGTTNLVYDYNMSSVSLAYFDGTRVTFGVIYNPFCGDLFVAKAGGGAYLNGVRLGKAPDRELQDCIVEFGAGVTWKQYADESFALAKDVFENCLDLRRICSSALAVAYIAAGKLNGYFERVLKPWDYAAATLMLAECGCICSDWDGNPIQYEHPTTFVCGTPKVYEYLRGAIQKHRKF